MSEVSGAVEANRAQGHDSFVILFHDTKFHEGGYALVKEKIFDNGPMKSYVFVKASECYLSCEKEFCGSPVGYSLWE